MQLQFPAEILDPTCSAVRQDVPVNKIVLTPYFVLAARISGSATDAALSAETRAVVLDYGKTGLSLIWLLGSVSVLAWSLVRVYRFNRLLGMESEVAPQELRTVAARIASRLGLKAIPAVYTTSAHLSPMVWWIGGKVRIVMPAALLDRMDTRRFQWILAHELAHVRRRDYMVRWIEWLACVCFWWNPVVWWARHHLRANEELCCDALVLSSLKPKPRTYADSLLTAVECLVCPAFRPPAVASEINGGGFLERRFRMIVSETANRSNSRWLQTCVLLCAVVVLPLGLGYGQDSSTETVDAVALAHLKTMYERACVALPQHKAMEDAQKAYNAARNALPQYWPMRHAEKVHRGARTAWEEACRALPEYKPWYDAKKALGDVQKAYWAACRALPEYKPREDASKARKDALKAYEAASRALPEYKLLKDAEKTLEETGEGSDAHGDALKAWSQARDAYSQARQALPEYNAYEDQSAIKASEELSRVYDAAREALPEHKALTDAEKALRDVQKAYYAAYDAMPKSYKAQYDDATKAYKELKKAYHAAREGALPEKALEESQKAYHAAREALPEKAHYDDALKAYNDATN